MTRIPLIVGNWKMHKTAAEARAFVSALNPLITTHGRSVLLAVPYTAIEAAATAARGTRIRIGRTATPKQAQEVHQLICRWFEERFGRDCRENLRVLYGGSVKPDNISELMAQPDIDGVLVGGASLESAHFAQIVNYKSMRE